MPFDWMVAAALFALSFAAMVYVWYAAERELSRQLREREAEVAQLRAEVDAALRLCARCGHELEVKP